MESVSFFKIILRKIFYNFQTAIMLTVRLKQIESFLKRKQRLWPFPLLWETVEYHFRLTIIADNKEWCWNRLNEKYFWKCNKCRIHIDKDMMKQNKKLTGTTGDFLNNFTSRKVIMELKRKWEVQRLNVKAKEKNWDWGGLMKGQNKNRFQEGRKCQLNL